VVVGGLILTTADEEEERLVHKKLGWEPTQTAKLIADKSLWSLPIRSVGRTIRKERFGDIKLETPAVA